MDTKRRIHGMCGTKVYGVWRNIRDRCYGVNPQARTYKEKNIQVCDAWHEASVFLDWAMNSGYEEGLQIDRIDNNGDYCPENCRWVTSRENNLNKNNTIRITHNGETKLLHEWAEIKGMKRQTLYVRIKRGWSINKALNKKVNKQRN